MQDRLTGLINQGPNRMPPSSDFETTADWLIISGDYRQAEQVLLDGINRTYSQSQKDFHHLSLKLLSVPLYELASLHTSPEAMQSAEAVYGHLGELLGTQINQPEYPPSRQPSRYRHGLIGDVSELLVATLMARDYCQGGERVLLPATKEQDRGGGASSEPADFILTPLSRLAGASDLRLIQVKTLASERSVPQPVDSESVYTVSVSQLDKHHYGRQRHRSSLSSRLLRELSGQATQSDIDHINEATNRLYELVNLPKANHRLTATATAGEPQIAY